MGSICYRPKYVRVGPFASITSVHCSCLYYPAFYQLMLQCYCACHIFHELTQLDISFINFENINTCIFNWKWTVRFARVPKSVDIIIMVQIVYVTAVVDFFCGLCKAHTIGFFNITKIITVSLIQRQGKVVKNAVLIDAYKLEWKSHLYKHRN